MASHDASHSHSFGGMPVEDDLTTVINDGNGDGDGDGDVATSCPLEPIGDVQGSENRQASVSASTSTILCDTTSLFVGGLHPRIGDLHLQKLFSPYGEIVRINIVTSNPSDSQSHNIHSKSTIPTKYKLGLQQSKGYAFVEYTRVESAQLAIARLDGRQLMGRSLAVRPSRRNTSKPDRVGSGINGKTHTNMSAEEARREYRVVQSKIDAVKRAIDQKQKGS